jgi:hypothetical protein
VPLVARYSFTLIVLPATGVRILVHNVLLLTRRSARELAPVELLLRLRARALFIRQALWDVASYLVTLGMAGGTV